MHEKTIYDFDFSIHNDFIVYFILVDTERIQSFNLSSLFL
jgi:hypothetical protein